MNNGIIEGILRKVEAMKRDIERLQIYEMSAPIGARVYNSAAISHATSGTWQALTFNSERYDTGRRRMQRVDVGLQFELMGAHTLRQTPEWQLQTLE